MASATTGSILPGGEAGTDANESASRGFGGHAEGRHLIVGFAEEGVHGGFRTEAIVPGNALKLGLSSLEGQRISGC